MRGALERAATARGSTDAYSSLFTLLVLLLLVAALFAGESFWTGAAALATAATVLALALADRIPLSPGGVPLVAALLGLAAWSGVSIAWSVAPDRSWDDLNRGLVYAGFAVLGVAAGSLGSRALRLVALTLAAALGAAVLWALAGKVVPALFPDGGRAARLRDPIGYWNALALAANALLVLGLWLASRPVVRSIRCAGVALAYAAVVATLLAVSRAGLLGAIVAVALWLLLSDAPDSEDRIERSLLALAPVVPAVAVSTWAFTRPALVEDGQAYADRVADGAWLGFLLAAGAVAAVVAAARLSTVRLTQPARRTTGRLLALGAVAAVVLVAAAVALVPDPADGGASVQGPGRFGDASLNNRWGWWGEAWQLFAERPFQGSGAASFEVAHRRLQDVYVPAVEPHSVPLQFLAGSGILGLLLFAAVVGAVATAAARALRRTTGEERAAAAALAVVTAVYLLHALVDYSWSFLAVTAPALVAAGALAAAGTQPGERRRRPFAALAALAVGLACLGSLASPWLADRSVRQVNRELDAGDPEAAAAAARRARMLDPLSIEPSLKLAGVETRRDRPEAARRAYAQAIRSQPENPDTWYALGNFEFSLDDLCNAYVHLNEAYTLDPASRRWTDGGPLDISRAHVNAGRC
ncbi:MAG: O-antigen ligase family protein [Gaiellaceae bacterium MAG52_C11]|nr:O-antigen ligase family protein [Candidatus Gaiellasilicea maunaloa]